MRRLPCYTASEDRKVLTMTQDIHTGKTSRRAFVTSAAAGFFIGATRVYGRNAVGSGVPTGPSIADQRICVVARLADRAERRPYHA